MKAAVLFELGKPPRYDDFQEPEAQDGEVLVHVLAASLKNLDKGRASGKHYDSFRVLPAVSGVDGVGRLDDGRRVYCGNARAPFGMMADRTVVRGSAVQPVPDDLDDVLAAALPNGALSSWAPLVSKAKLVAGETVCIMGATGVSGKLAVQIAKHLGAARVVATGRDEQALAELRDLGADSTVSLRLPDEELFAALKAELKQGPFDVILDFLWGHPAEILIDALTGHDLTAAPVRTRFIQIGSMAGPTINLPASALRSTALEMYGSGGGSVDVNLLWKLLAEMYEFAASGGLKMNTTAVPLSEVESAWSRPTPNGERIVFVP